MSFLSETFPTKLARKRLLSRVRSDVDIDTVLVLEALVADVAVVEQPALLFRLLPGPTLVFSHFGDLRGEDGGGDAGGGGGAAGADDGGGGGG